MERQKEGRGTVRERDKQGLETQGNPVVYADRFREIPHRIKKEKIIFKKLFFNLQKKIRKEKSKVNHLKSNEAKISFFHFRLILFSFSFRSEKKEINKPKRRDKIGPFVWHKR